MTSQRHNVPVSESGRTTVDLDPELHRALRLR